MQQQKAETCAVKKNLRKRIEVGQTTWEFIALSTIEKICSSLRLLKRSFCATTIQRALWPIRACFATLEYSDTADIVILVSKYYDYKCFVFFWKLELNASI